MDVVNIEIFNPKPLVIKDSDGNTIAEIKKIPAMVNVILFQDEKLFTQMLTLSSMNDSAMTAAITTIYKNHHKTINEIIALCIGKDSDFVQQNFGFYDVMMTLAAIVREIVEETHYQTVKKKELMTKASK